MYTQIYWKPLLAAKVLDNTGWDRQLRFLARVSNGIRIVYIRMFMVKTEMCPLIFELALFSLNKY